MTTQTIDGAPQLSTFGTPLVPAWERRRGVLTHPFKVLFLALRVQRERRELLELGNEQLEDMGLSRDDVQREASRELFDIPQERIDAMYQ